VGVAGQGISGHAEDAWPMKIYRMCDQAKSSVSDRQNLSEEGGCIMKTFQRMEFM
jgi:hypothetical protein